MWFFICNDNGFIMSRWAVVKYWIFCSHRIETKIDNIIIITQWWCAAYCCHLRNFLLYSPFSTVIWYKIHHTRWRKNITASETKLLEPVKLVFNLIYMSQWLVCFLVQCDHLLWKVYLTCPIKNLKSEGKQSWCGSINSVHVTLYRVNYIHKLFRFFGLCFGVLVNMDMGITLYFLQFGVIVCFVLFCLPGLVFFFFSKPGSPVCWVATVFYHCTKIKTFLL